MPGHVPTRPSPVYVWLTVLLFFLWGIYFACNGLVANSIGAVAFGGLLLLAGICHSIRYFIAIRRDSEK